jgi:flagellar FliL protein
VRFLQISMEVMAHDQKAIDSVQKNMPLIRNNLLLLMSNRNYQALMSREGKDKLRGEALAEIRDVQKKQGGGDVDDLLFTSFVVQ